MFKDILLSALVLCIAAKTIAANGPGNTPNPITVEGSADPNPAFPYDISYPYSYFDLDENLKHVSGLTASSDLKTVTCVQSDDGKAYKIDRKTGAITSSIFFVTEGEFEGIEMVGDTLFAAKGNGQLYKVWNLNGAHKNVKMVRTGLPRTENVEGLGYDLQRNRLLMSSKGQKEGEFTKKIYEFDVKTNATNPIPAYEITLASFKAFLTDKKADKNYAKLYDDYVAHANPKGFDFAPSSLSVHPVDGNIYVLSSINNVLLVINQKGQIVEMSKLKKESHIAPTGICFDEEGTMYISNESRDGKPAKLFEYKMQKTAITASRK